MVTLIGFFFIIANVALLLFYVLDLVGPVRGLNADVLPCPADAGL